MPRVVWQFLSLAELLGLGYVAYPTIPIPSLALVTFAHTFALCVAAPQSKPIAYTAAFERCLSLPSALRREPLGPSLSVDVVCCPGVGMYRTMGAAQRHDV